MTIKFDNIGLNWIVQPKTMNINVCKGICSSRGTKASVYSKIISGMMKKGLLQNHQLTCCKPLVIEKQTIIANISRKIKVENVKIRVRKCSCSWCTNISNYDAITYLIEPSFSWVSAENVGLLVTKISANFPGSEIIPARKTFYDIMPRYVNLNFSLKAFI